MPQTRLVESVYAGALDGKGPDRGDYASDEDYAAAYNTWQAKIGQTANLIGGAVGYVFSGGSAANVSATASIAKSGILNNYLWHQQADMLERAKSNLQACEADGNCSPEELARYRERIAYFEGLDQYTDQQLRAECDANPSGALCKAYVADALCAAELRSTALCGGVPGFGVERWGYRSPTAMWNAEMFANGRDYNASFGIASANLQHQQDTFDLLAEYATSVNAVRGNDSMGIALEMSVAAIGAGVLGRIPKGGLQGLAGSFGERQFQLSRVNIGTGANNAPTGGFGPMRRAVDDPILDGILNSNYGQVSINDGRVGNGGTADALRYEDATGELLSPNGHRQAAEQMRTRLQTYVRRATNSPNPNSAGTTFSQRDIDYANELIADLNNALGN